MDGKKAYLVLENGIVFEGESFGYEKEISGEVVFTTSMVGYLETLTDPRYSGQLVVQTFPLIGNYGVIEEDLENDIAFPGGYIVREWCQNPSNFRSEGDIDTFLKEKQVAGICGIDTRKLTKILREEGTLRGKICYELTQTVKFAKPSKAAIYDLKTAPITVYTKENAEYKVAALNLGAKKSFFKSFANINAEVISFGPNAKAPEILELKPDGIVITGGPGNPDDYDQVLEQVEVFMESGIPVFGIGLGHELMAMAEGAKTAKLPYGHRGSSQPVLDVEADRVLITGQNHGYYVISQTLPKTAEELYKNVNDGTCEGILYTNKPAFSIQFDPTPAAEDKPGPFFGRFAEMMKEGR